MENQEALPSTQLLIHFYNPVQQEKVYNGLQDRNLTETNKGYNTKILKIASSGLISYTLISRCENLKTFS